MAQLRPSVLYTLLTIGSITIGSLIIFGLFHDSQKLEGNRYENSYAEFNNVELTEKQHQALELLKNRNIEWAHFRFIEAIKNYDFPQVNAFIDAGMQLKSSSILLEVALSQSANKKDMLILLSQQYKLNFNALYHLPAYVSAFDEQLELVSKPYILKKQDEHEQAKRQFAIDFKSWEQQKKLKESDMLLEWIMLLEIAFMCLYSPFLPGKMTRR